MKKFVGNVNGKSFDNEEDFNKEAKEAIKKNDGTLSISSYYSYTSDSVEENKDDDKFVSTSEYLIGGRKPDKVTSDSVEYNFPDVLATRIKEASNKDSIRKNVEYYVSNLVDSIHKCSKEVDELVTRIKEASNKDIIRKNVERHVNNLVDSIQNYSKSVDKLEHEIESLQKSLYEKINERKELEGRWRYYDAILDYLDEPEVEETKEETKEEVKEEHEKEYVKPIIKKDLKDFFDVDVNTSLYSILRQFGILK